MSTLLARAAKALTALGGALAEIAALGLLHGAAQSWVTGAVAVLTALGVYRVPNAIPPALPAATSADTAVSFADPPPPPG